MADRKQRILIAGGAGYIGSVLSGQALAAGFHVRVVDNLSFGGRGLLPWLSHPKFEFVRGDVTDRKTVERCLRDVDHVVHLAALVGDPACKQQPELAVEINEGGTKLVYELAVAGGARRFVFASTCSNYGRMPDADGYVDEDSALNPISLYAELKVGIERFLMDQDDDIGIGLLRFATAHGLSPRPRFDLTINEFTRDLAMGKPLEIFGGQFWRPYCHVRDLARACLMVLAAPLEIVHRQPLNVGDNNENFRKQQIVDQILERLPEAAELISLVQRDEDPRDYRVRFDRIRKQLGFQVSRRTRDSIHEMADAIQGRVIDDPFAGHHRNT